MLDKDFLNKILLDLDWISSWMINLINERIYIRISHGNQYISVSIHFNYQEIKKNLFKVTSIPICKIGQKDGYFYKDQLEVIESINRMFKCDESANKIYKEYRLNSLRFLVYYNLIFFEYDRHINNLDTMLSLSFDDVNKQFYESISESNFGESWGKRKQIFSSDQFFLNWTNFINPFIIEHIPINTNITYPKKYEDLIRKLDQKPMKEYNLEESVSLDHELLTKIFISFVRCSKKVTKRKNSDKDENIVKPTEIFKDFIGKGIIWRDVTLKIKYFEKIKMQIIIKDKKTRLMHPHEFGFSKKSNSPDVMLDLLQDYHGNNDQLKLYPTLDYKSSWKQTKELLKKNPSYYKRSHLSLKARTNRLRGIIKELLTFDGKSLIEDKLPISDPRTDGYYHLRFTLEIE